MDQLASRIHESEILAAVTNPEKVIRPLGTLHLTLGVMSLTKPDKLQGALQLLQELDTPSLMRDVEIENLMPDTTISASGDAERHPVAVSLTSLKSMSAASKSAILYSEPVDPTGRLRPFCEHLRKAFESAGFMVQESRPLLLHATMVNTVYAKGRMPSGGEDSQEDEEAEQPRKDRRSRRRQKRLTIDATALISQYSGVVLVENIQLEKLTICKMGAKPILDQDGHIIGEEYEVVGERSL